MPPLRHAVLSASSSHKWLNCTPSAMLEKSFENKGNESAAEGTAAHELCEYKLKKALKRQSKQPISDYNTAEMEECSDSYVDFVMEQYEQAKQNCKDPVVLIEQRLDFSAYVPDGFGTGDCLIVSDGTLHIIDFKYGIGILVKAEYNPQMMLYALGALTIYQDLYDIESVSMSIFQPRRENVSTWKISVTDLLEWAENELKPKAELAANGEGEYCSGEWCTFCRAKAVCRKRTEDNLKIARLDFQDPPLLSDEEVAEVLTQLPDLTKWATEVQDYALEQAVKHGKQWTGFKVVRNVSRRKYIDEDKAAQTAIKAGYEDIYRSTLIPITEMEKLMGKKNFAEILGGLVHKLPGKLTLVPETDKRPAADIFEDFKED